MSNLRQKVLVLYLKMPALESEVIAWATYDDTVGIFHHGLWHGAGINFSDNIRYMFKVRLAPTEKQELLWDPEKKYKPLSNRALFWTDESTDITVNDILTKKYPWQENDTHRLDIINRIKMWRLLTGDSNLDIDYWMTRVENERY